MHLSRLKSARDAVLLSLSLWAVASICYLTPTALEGLVTPRYFRFLALCATTGVTLTLGLSLIFRRSRDLARGRRVALWITSATLAILIHACLDTGVYLAMYKPRLGAALPDHLDPRLEIFVLNVMLLGAVYVIYCAGLALSLSSEALQLRERRLAAALATVQEAQLAALRLQINPHFLFNALNAATALIGSGRNAEAEKVVGRLADFFRASLNAPVATLVSVEEEFDIVAAYLHIEMARFGDRLRLELEVPEALNHALAPHFLLQPLVENAIKHGVARTRSPVTLTVSALATDGVLTLAVRDDAPTYKRPNAPASGSGVGLANVRARLAALFGDRGELRTTSLRPGFLAEVRIPLTHAPASMAPIRAGE